MELENYLLGGNFVLASAKCWNYMPAHQPNMKSEIKWKEFRENAAATQTIHLSFCTRSVAAVAFVSFAASSNLMHFMTLHISIIPSRGSALLLHSMISIFFRCPFDVDCIAEMDRQAEANRRNSLAKWRTIFFCSLCAIQQIAFDNVIIVALANAAQLHDDRTEMSFIMHPLFFPLLTFFICHAIFWRAIKGVSESHRRTSRKNKPTHTHTQLKFVRNAATANGYMR